MWWTLGLSLLKGKIYCMTRTLWKQVGLLPRHLPLQNSSSGLVALFSRWNNRIETWWWQFCRSFKSDHSLRRSRHCHIRESPRRTGCHGNQFIPDNPRRGRSVTEHKFRQWRTLWHEQGVWKGVLRHHIDARFHQVVSNGFDRFGVGRCRVCAVDRL